MKQLIDRLQPALRVLNAAYRRLCSSRQNQIVTISVLATCAALVYAREVRDLQTKTQAFGKYTVVHIAAREIAIGEPITASDTQTFTMPSQFVLPSTLLELSESLTATTNIQQGDVISEQNTSASDQRVAVPAGMRAVSIVPRIAMPALQPGSLVDIVANGQIIAARGIVLSTLDDNSGIVIAVSESTAPAVASAAATGEAAIVLAN